jgi:hypothetical protein
MVLNQIWLSGKTGILQETLQASFKAMRGLFCGHVDMGNYILSPIYYVPMFICVCMCVPKNLEDPQVLGYDSLG